MTLCRLQVEGLRILRAARLDPVPGVNLILGDNGAGKTSLLEAIHLLATGHSFRTRQLAPLLPAGTDVLQITASLRTNESPDGIPIGIRKSRGETRVRMRGRTLAGQAELARALPVQALHPESHVLIGGPPAQRRAFLDWGAFHRDARFQAVWQRYRRLLEQRNAALRAGSPVAVLSAWDEPLALAGMELDQARQAYVVLLESALQGLWTEWPDVDGLTCEYRRGWSADIALTDALARSRERDRSAGFTQAGPHRAELVWRLDGRPAADVASRGQQKALVAMLKLAQAQVMQSETGRAPIILVDDLPSELDTVHRERVLSLLRQLRGQVFVTAIHGEQVDLGGWSSVQMFHVEHGRVRVVPVDGGHMGRF